MTGLSAPCFGLLFALAAVACAEPAQLGGLGVFNPNGFGGRMQLASRVSVADAPDEPAVSGRAPRPRAAEPEPPAESAVSSPCAH